MDLRHADSDSPMVAYLLTTIGERLNRDQKVLWLVSGGSAITPEIEVAKQLKNVRSNLTVTLMDERYGPPGHPDSNYRQLIDKGFALDSIFKPVLSGQDLQATTRQWDKEVRLFFKEADYVIGIAGIGPDGHTLGIKPGSPSVGSSDFAVGYEWEDYTRITLSGQAIKNMDEIVVFAMGPEKKQQLLALSKDLPVNEQPAQLLKLCPKITVFSDQIN